MPEDLNPVTHGAKQKNSIQAASNDVSITVVLPASKNKSSNFCCCQNYELFVLLRTNTFTHFHKKVIFSSSLLLFKKI